MRRKFHRRPLFFILVGLCAVASADTITSASGNFLAFPNNPGSPPSDPSMFWNNYSMDSKGGNHQMNVGDLLSDSGGFAGTPSILGSDTVSQTFAGSGGDDPAPFNLIRGVNALNITLLFADSSLDTGNATVGTVFGYYTGSAFTPVYTVGETFSPTGTEAFNPTASGGSYGFYATVCYAAGTCETYTSRGDNWGNSGGGSGWNHFALFQLASGNLAIGFEDTNGIFAEGSGDYNDVVIELSTVVATPEPNTVGIVGIGLIGVSLIMRRRLRWRL